MDFILLILRLLVGERSKDSTMVSYCHVVYVLSANSPFCCLQSVERETLDIHIIRFATASAGTFDTLLLVLRVYFGQGSFIM